MQRGYIMSLKSIFVVVATILFIPAASCWEYVATFDTNEGWKYFDDDTGPGTAIASGGGVLSVPAPSYGAWSWRYVFFDKDATSSVINNPDMDFTKGGYVQATLSYTGTAPMFAYFFLAGGGEDDYAYIDGTEGGSQTFWGTYNNPLTIAEDPGSTTTAQYLFNTSTFAVFSPGTEHRNRRGTPDSWATTIASVDAIGIALGYYGDPGESTVRIDEFTVTPEPSLLLLSGPLAGFLGWRIRRKTRKSPAKV